MLLESGADHQLSRLLVVSNAVLNTIRPVDREILAPGDEEAVLWVLVGTLCKHVAHCRPGDVVDPHGMRYDELRVNWMHPFG